MLQLKNFLFFSFIFLKFFSKIFAQYGARPVPAPLPDVPTTTFPPQLAFFGKKWFDSTSLLYEKWIFFSSKRSVMQRNNVAKIVWNCGSLGNAWTKAKPRRRNAPHARYGTKNLIFEDKKFLKLDSNWNWKQLVGQNRSEFHFGQFLANLRKLHWFWATTGSYSMNLVSSDLDRFLVKILCLCVHWLWSIGVWQESVNTAR